MSNSQKWQEARSAGKGIFWRTFAAQIPVGVLGERPAARNDREAAFSRAQPAAALPFLVFFGRARN